MFNVTRLNHAVLWVRDADKAADFYHRVFGFEELERPRGDARRLHALADRRQPP